MEELDWFSLPAVLLASAAIPEARRDHLAKVKLLIIEVWLP